MVSLQSGYVVQAAGFGNFQVGIELSTEGLEHVDEIIQLMFNYIGMMQSSGPKQWVHEELAELRAVTFRFKDKEQPMAMASCVAARLQRIPFKHVLSSPHLLTNYEPVRIKELLSMLIPSNMKIQVVSQKFKGQEGNTNEPVYGTEIKVTRISSETMQKYEEALKTSHHALHLPEKNQYIATKFDQKPRELVKSDHPRLINDDEWSRVWFKQDDEYKMPKQETKLALTTPIVSQSPRMTLLSRLWLRCLSVRFYEFRQKA